MYDDDDDGDDDDDDDDGDDDRVSLAICRLGSWCILSLLRLSVVFSW